MKSFGYYVIRGLLFPLSHLPLGFHRAFSRFAGWLMHSVFHYRRDVVMINLSRSFPDKKYDELDSICRMAYRRIATIFCEAIWFGAATPGKLKKARIAEIDNPELLNSFIDKGKSVFVLTSHCGNWELLGGYKSYARTQALSIPENDICVVYKELSSRAWDQFMFRNRLAPIADKTHYDGLVESFHIMRYAYRNKDVPKIYNFINDQSPYSESSKVKVNDFMHQTTYSMNGAPALAKLFGTALVYLNMKVNDNGSYTMHFTTIAEDASLMEVKDMLDAYYGLLQKDLEEQPWNYLWTHKRWKI